MNRQLNQSIGNITDSFMLKKKKTSNKQNPKLKKIPQLTIPSNYHTQQIRIPTNSSMDLKPFNKTIEIKKNTTIQTKKSISRKSTNQSIKPTIVLNSPNLHRIFKDFKELKLIHQNQSKSPKSSKSKSGKKYKSNKTSFKTLKSNTVTIKNSSLKLQKTLKKLNLTELFREELSELPIASISEGAAHQQPTNIFEFDHQQMINLVQLRQFCQTAALPPKKSITLTSKNIDFFKQTNAALKIQRAWKRFRTKRIINRYIFFIKSRLSQRIQHENSSNFFSDNDAPQLDIFSSDLYQQVDDQNSIKQISQLSKRSNKNEDNAEYQEEIEIIKHQQLDKWNEIIAIIKQADRSNPSGIQKLIATITAKSQINKKRLEECSSSQIKANEEMKEFEQSGPLPVVFQTIDFNNVKPIIPGKQPIKYKQIAKEGQNNYQYLSPQSKSENSVEEHQEYNCRKYVNYLDCDIYPFEKDNLSGSSHKKLEKIVQKSTISKKKQEILLNELKNQNIPNHLGESKLYSSNSLISLNCTIKQQNEIHAYSNSKSNLNKVNSEKILRHSLMCCSEQEPKQQQDGAQMQRQYLQEGDIIDESNDAGRHLATDHSNQNEGDMQDNEFIQFNNSEEKKEQNKTDLVFKRSNQPLDMYHDDQKQSEQLSFFKMHSIENEEQASQQNTEKAEQEIIQCEQQQHQPIDRQQDIHDISILIFNSLVLDCLKDISKSDYLANAFKSYSKNIRPKIKRCESGVRKKGFPTDKKEIESFLQCIINYLKKYEEKIFKNLEVPTGPSAIEMLRYMHDSSQQESLSACNDEDEANIMVIPNRIFQLFWQLKEKSIIVEVPANFNDTNAIVFRQNFDYLKNFNKIFYRSLFDTLNQCLDYSRNFGQFGRPFPWKRAAMFSHPLSQSKIEFGIASARKRMMDLATTYCGLIIEKEDMNDLGGNEEYITQVQEDRLSRMLANDLIDCENKWIFYDDEEAEILIQLSDIIYREIFKELIEQLYLLI